MHQYRMHIQAKLFSCFYNFFMPVIVLKIFANDTRKQQMADNQLKLNE